MKMPQTQGSASKRILLFRNGDANYAPVEYVYSQYKTRNWHKFLEDLDRTVNPREQMYGRAGTGSAQLYTTGGQPITSLDDFENSNENYFVIAGQGGREQFREVPNGYESIIARDLESRKPWKDLIDGDNKSYLDLNRAKYGDAKSRKDHERIYNRQQKAKVTKIYLRRNNDRNFEPKRYIIRHAQTSKLETLFSEFEKLAPPGNGSKLGSVVRDSNEKEVDSMEDFVDDETYTVCGTEPYTPMKVQARNKNSTPKNRKSTSESNGADSGYAEQHHDADNYQSDDSHPDTGGRPKWRPVKASDELDWDAIQKKDSDFLNTHYSMRSLYNVRPKYNDASQIHTESKRIFCFLNGQSEGNSTLLFTKPQQSRGLNWVIERISKCFNVNGQKLFTMGGERVRKTSELINSGAYILVPMGQSFRDTWYYLPKLAIDTSNNNDGDEDNERDYRPDMRRSQSFDDDRHRAGRDGDRHRRQPYRDDDRNEARYVRDVGSRPPNKHSLEPDDNYNRSNGRQLAPIRSPHKQRQNYQQRNRNQVRRPHSANAAIKNNVPDRQRQHPASKYDGGKDDFVNGRRDSWGDALTKSNTMSRFNLFDDEVNMVKYDNSKYRQKLQFEKTYEDFGIRQQKPIAARSYGKIWRN